MQAVEAMTRLIGLADEMISVEGSIIPWDGTINYESLEELKVATAVCTAMLNTALPVARYRVFVRYDHSYPRDEIGSEFTLCSTRMKDIRAALSPLQLMKKEVYITLFEQKDTGADMISGYQGQTRSLNNKFKKWLDNLALIDLKNAVA